MKFQKTLDLVQPEYIVIDVVQDEVGAHFFEIQFAQEGVVFDIMHDHPEGGQGGGASINGGINYIKPDKTRGSYDRIDGRPVVDYDNDTKKWTVELAPQMFTCSGRVMFNIWITVEWWMQQSGETLQGTQKYLTFPICLNVHPNAVPDGVPSTDYYNLHTLIDIQTMVEDLEDEVSTMAQTVTSMGTDINNIRGATVNNTSAIAAIQQQITGIVKSVNSQTPASDGNVSLDSRNVPYTSTNTQIYYDSPVESVKGALGYMEEAFMNRPIIHLYSASGDVHIEETGMRTINVSDLAGGPNLTFVWVGDLVIDLDSRYVGKVISTGSNGAVLVQCLGKRVGG